VTPDDPLHAVATQELMVAQARVAYWQEQLRVAGGSSGGGAMTDDAGRAYAGLNADLEAENLRLRAALAAAAQAEAQLNHDCHRVRRELHAARTALAASAAVVVAAARSQWVLAQCCGGQPPPNWDALARDASTAYAQMRDALVRATARPALTEAGS
jgi:hypothetical protein